MSVLSSVLGFSTFGLAARLGQLGIQKRSLVSNPGGHALAMLAFGFAGYWAHVWDERAAELLADKKKEILKRRAKQEALTAQAS